jgi:hypothetical protein
MSSQRSTELEGRTSFVIAHRLSTIRDADLITYIALALLAAIRSIEPQWDRHLLTAIPDRNSVGE